MGDKIKTLLNKVLQYLIIAFLFQFALLTSSYSQSVKAIVKDSLILPTLTELKKASSLKALKRDIDKVLSDKGLRKTKIGIAIYSLDENKYYYQKNIDMPLTPASTTKLFTTFTALYTLGYDYEIKTSIYTDADNIKDSVLKGNLYIYGRGDILLSVTDIEVMAEKIYEMGIRKITGNIYADGSYFDEMTNRKTYSKDKDQVEPLPPITALSVERNTATILMSSGPSSGVPVNVYVIPASESFQVINKAIVKGRSKKGKSSNDIDIHNKLHKEFLPEIIRFGDAAPTRRRRRKNIRVKTQPITNGIQKFIISGYLKPNNSYSYRYFIQNPILTVAGTLKNRLIAAGINVAGNIDKKNISDLQVASTKSKVKSSNINNANVKLLAEHSRPIYDLVYQANKESDNLIAETLYKITGSYAGGIDDNGRKAKFIRKMIFDSLNINLKGCVMNDGSGLSRRNKVTARSLVSLLIKAQYTSFADGLDSSLSIAGIDGTLEKRFWNTQAEDNLRAKTGTLRNVSALAGYVSTFDGELIVFAMLFNGPYVYNYKAAEDEICRLLASFFYFDYEER